MKEIDIFRLFQWLSIPTSAVFIMMMLFGAIMDGSAVGASFVIMVGIPFVYIMYMETVEMEDSIVSMIVGMTGVFSLLVILLTIFFEALI